MLKLDVPAGNATTVVNSGDVDRMSAQGYHPVAAFEEDVYFPSVSGSYNYSTGQNDVIPAGIRKVTRVLMARTQTETERANTISALETKVAQANEAARSAAHNHDRLQGERDRLKEQLREEQQRLGAVRAEHQTLQERARKMERDLGAVRQALGDIRMNEILAAGKK